MSKEILSQEEIDALLQGLSEEEDSPGDLTGEILETAVAEIEEDLGLTFQGWEATFASPAQVMDTSGGSWGTVDYSGDIDARGYWRIERGDHEDGEAEEDGAADAGSIGSLITTIASTLAKTLADCRGCLLEVEVSEGQPSPPAPGEVGDDDWYEVKIGFEGAEGENLDLILSLPEDIRQAVQEDSAGERESSAAAVDEGPQTETTATYAPTTASERSDPEPPKQREKEVSPASFPSFEQGSSRSQGPRNDRIDMLLDVPLQVSVELGRSVEDIRKVMSLGTGSIIDLDRQAGEPVDVLVNGKLLARGEVVVVDENFAVRITEIVSLEDRIRNLR